MRGEFMNIDISSVWEFGSEIFEGGLLNFTITAAVILIVSSLVNKAVGGVVNRIDKTRLSYRYIRKIVNFIITFTAVMFILNSVKPVSGIVKTLMSATGLITIIGGLAAQESFGNFIAGFFLSLYQPFNVGDIVYLPEKNISGTVTEMTFRHTVLKTISSSKIIIPNSVMNSAVLEDREYGQGISTKWMNLSVAYGTDIPLMKKLITQAVLETEGTLDLRSEEDKNNGVPPVTIRVDDFLDSGLAVTFAVSTEKFGDSFGTAAQVRERVLELFAENGIEIPYTKIELVGKE